MLRRVNFALAEYEEAETWEELEAAGMAFHQALYCRCENASLLRLIEQMRRSLKRVYELKPKGSALRKTATAEHRKLALLCERGNVPAATALLVSHLAAAQAALGKSLSKAARKTSS